MIRAQAQLLALAERCEAAKGPDRELDAQIAVALEIGARGLLPDDHEYLSLPNKRDPGPGVTVGHYWFHCRSGMSLRSADFYTASLDAALKLVPEGWEPSISCGPTFALAATDDKPWGVSLIGNNREYTDEDGYQSIAYDSHDANARTGALALCATALRAQAQGASK